MIALMACEDLAVKPSCRLLEVTRAGYYAASSVDRPRRGRSATPGSQISSWSARPAAPRSLVPS